MCTVQPNSYEDATSLVTMGEGKFYSLGLDLTALGALSAMEMQQFAYDLQKLLLRLLTFPLVTVAAINGQWLSLGISIMLLCMRTTCTIHAHIQAGSQLQLA